MLQTEMRLAEGRKYSIPQLGFTLLLAILLIVFLVTQSEVIARSHLYVPV